MRLGVALPNLGPLADRAIMRDAIGRAEDSGLSDIWVGDHVAYPVTMTFPRPDYPGYSLPGQGPILDPLAVLAYAAAVTSRLRLGTSVLVIGYRNPVLTARMLQSIDHLSDGRVICGAAAGWMKEEFDVLGGDYANRGAVTTEYVALMRRLWTQDAVTSRGPLYPVDSLTLNPRGRRGIPVWIGGNGKAAQRRVVEVGDGWQPVAPPVAGFAEQVSALRRDVHDAGRDGSACAVSVRLIWGGAATAATTGPAGLPADPDVLLERLGDYARGGAEHALLTLRASTAREYLSLLERVCTEVIPFLPSAAMSA
jgi:probable F420-dependent oxidoreductase